MPELLHSRSIVFSALVLSAVASVGFFGGGDAKAGDIFQCQGPSKNKVMSCCRHEVELKKPIWMIGTQSSCEQAVQCDPRLARLKRCRVVIPPTITNSSNPPPPPKGVLVSDMRAKTNLHLIGKTVLDLPLYSFEYKNRSGTFIGVMAQDVLKVKPSAVTLGADGLYRVDYQALGIEMVQVQ